jgi:hypothetical protein
MNQSSLIDSLWGFKIKGELIFTGLFFIHEITALVKSEQQ